ncbi:MAG: DUF1801 domain-containing protein [Bacteroidota bacterium]
MAKNKTTETKSSVPGYVATIKDAQRRKDFEVLIELISAHTGFEAKMWGTAIVGFGSYHYMYDSGREGDAPLTGIASRTNAITLYLCSVFEKREELLAKLGKHKTDKGCVYIQRLEDIDTAVLLKMVKNSMKYYQQKYPVAKK